MLTTMMIISAATSTFSNSLSLSALLNLGQIRCHQRVFGFHFVHSLELLVEFPPSLSSEAASLTFYRVLTCFCVSARSKVELPEDWIGNGSPQRTTEILPC